MGKATHFSGSSGITVIKDNGIAMGGPMGHHMIGQGASQQPMMGRRLADQGH